jgi:hypothetical protein
MPQVSLTRLSALPRVRGQWADTGRSAHRSPGERFASPGPPSRCLKPRNTEISLFPKTSSRGIARARARAKSRFFDRPYNPRMQEHFSTCGGNAVKLGLANMLHVGPARLSALPCIQGERADAGHSAHSLSVDWQAWGTQGGPCWRAPRDGVRHVPAGPPKLRSRKNPSKPDARDALKPRFPARTATISVEHLSQGIWAKTARETTLPNRNPVLWRAPSAGAGKNAHFPSRSFSARGALGVAVGVGVRTTDSHALSNTWESVQKFGLLGLWPPSTIDCADSSARIESAA